jgi:hypothetical protein
MQVLISYAREDRQLAERLYEDLRSQGLDPWLDKKNILPGSRWKIVIRDAISSITVCGCSPLLTVNDKAWLRER